VSVRAVDDGRGEVPSKVMKNTWRLLIVIESELELDALIFFLLYFLFFLCIYFFFFFPMLRPSSMIEGLVSAEKRKKLCWWGMTVPGINSFGRVGNTNWWITCRNLWSSLLCGRHELHGFPSQL
jgi:hypothetical protein